MNHETLHGQIRQIRQHSFNEDNFSVGYPVDRGLTTRAIIDNPLVSAELGYVDLLPTFQGKQVDEVIQDKIDEQGHVSVLDLGCGSGRFLIDVKEKWGDSVYPVGVSAFSYHLEKPAYKIAGRPKGATGRELGKLGIPIVIGDAHHLRRNLVISGITPQFDVVVSVMTFMYFADPLNVLKQVHRSLNDGGVAFINDFGIDGSVDPETHGFLTAHLKRERGFDFNYKHAQLLPGAGGVAFEKTAPQLSLPLSYKVNNQELQYTLSDKMLHVTRR